MAHVCLHTDDSPSSTPPLLQAEVSQDFFKLLKATQGLLKGDDWWGGEAPPEPEPEPASLPGAGSMSATDKLAQNAQNKELAVVGPSSRNSASCPVLATTLYAIDQPRVTISLARRRPA